MKTKHIIQLIIFSLFITISSCTSDDEDNSDNNPNTGTETPTNAINLECDINTDTTLSNHSEGIDYIVNCDLQIKALITIESGTTIAFKSGASVFVDKLGALKAIGTNQDKITLKGEENIKGYWKGIAFESSDVRNELNHVIISDAGSEPISSIWYNKKAAVLLLNTLENGKLTLKNSIITNNDGYGLSLENGTTLSNFENNSFESNTNAAVRIDADNITKLDENSTYINNGFNGISIRESDLRSNATHIWKNLDYSIDGEIDIRTGLKILAGARLEFTPNGFMRAEGNSAYINAIGTPNNKVTFTGDVETAGSWKGLYFFNCNNIQNRFSYCDIKYGGSDDHTFVTNKANITLFNGSSATVNDSSLTNSGGCGIIVGISTITGWSQCTLINTNNTFSSNTGSNICDQG